MYKELVDELRDYDSPVIYEDANGQHVEHTGVELMERAADAIEKLQAELERVTRERDAATEDLRNLAIAHKTCYGCVNDKFNYNTDACAGCQYNSGHNWQWRGVTDTSKEG